MDRDILLINIFTKYTPFDAPISLIPSRRQKKKKQNFSLFPPPPIRSPLENEIAALRNEGTGE